MSEWKEARLDEMIDVNPSERLPKGTLAKKISMETLRPFTKKIPGFSEEEYNGGVKFKNGDTLIARITPSLENGKTSYVDILEEEEVGFGSTEFIVFREKSNVTDRHFLYYLAISPNFRDVAILSMTGSSGRQRVQTDVVKSHMFSFPPLPEQRAIASILSSLDDKIDLLHRQNQTLEKMAETLFRQWFVEEAKEDWDEGKLADIANFFNGKQRPNEIGSIPVYGGNGILGYSNTSNYSGKSIIIGRVGAYCGSLYYENKEIWVSDNALLVKAKNEDQTHFLFYLLKTLDLNSMAEGSSHPLLTQTLLKSIQINIPETKNIQQFDALVESIRKKTELNKTQIRTLTALRDTLLPKLMSGELRVSET